MIQCHAFNSFARLDVRGQGAYQLSQFVGGMAAVLFLFLAGVTFGFQMDRLDRKGRPAQKANKGPLDREEPRATKGLLDHKDLKGPRGQRAKKPQRSQPCI